MTFADLGLSPETLRAIEEVGYEHPTPIQEKAIPHVLMGRDVLGIAQTGTGKTAGFTLPMIEILANGRAKARMPRSLILAPTRELAAQVADNFTTYGKYHKLDMALLIGGESMGDQMRALDKGVDVLIATPGRLLDLFERGKVLLRDVKVLVIDEADRMLDMGFIPDVERIVTLLPPLRQTLFFSATMDKEIRKLADAFLSNPREVSIERRATAAETVAQQLAMVPRIDKREALRHILRTENVRNAFIFCNRKRDVDVLNRSLKKHGFNCISLHGDMDQPTRNEMLRRFKDGEADLLVCSDVAARGLDIDDVSHVINFDIPIHSEDYVHRIGRTGRAGKEGAAFSLATPDDAKYVAAIESLLGRPIPRMPLEGLECVMSEASEERADRSGGARRRRDSRGGDRSPARAGSAHTGSAHTGSAHTGSGNTGSDSGGGANGRGGRDRRGSRGRRDADRDGVRAMSHADDVLAFGDHTPAFFVTTALVPMGSGGAAGSDETEDDGSGERSRGTSRRSKGRSRDTRKGTSPTRRGERKRHGRRGDTGDSPEADVETGPAQDVEPEEVEGATPLSEGEDAATLDAEAVLDAKADGVGDANANANADEEAPAPRKRRATRRSSAVKAAAEGSKTSEDGDAPAADAEEAPKPKRTRRRKTAAESDDAAEGDAEAVPAKPKRTRRSPKKAVAEEDTNASSGDASSGDASEDSAPKPRTRRSRARKATPPAPEATDQPEGTGASPSEAPSTDEQTEPAADHPADA